ncbi:MAG: c-type cytochrome [Gammaproteobacteria bacterium]|nr:c-type cytochrome [Gammaproteobacteria bacterium]
MNRSRALALLLTGLLVSTPLLADGDPAAGRKKAFTCMGCHGVPGFRNAYPGYRVPKLGGQHAAYLVAALKAYRAEQRSHPTMRGHAATMTDTDMADIAAYFATVEPE